MAELLKDKVAVVTGAAQGIGAAIARAYAAEGAKVVVSDIAVEKLEAVAAELPGAVAVPCDVSDPAQVERLMAAAQAEHGRIDILNANAGVLDVAPLVEMSYEQWRGVMSVSLDGVFLSLRYAAPVMARGGGGVILTTCSITGQAGCPLVSHYCASKAAVMSLTQSAAIELRPMGIRVNAILPGFVDTEIVRSREAQYEELLDLPMPFSDIIAAKQGRFGEPEDIARTSVFLASDRAAFASGAGFVVDGGARASGL